MKVARDGKRRRRRDGRDRAALRARAPGRPAVRARWGLRGAWIEDRLRERERPCEEDGGSFAEGEGVWRRKSLGFVALVVVVLC